VVELLQVTTNAGNLYDEKGFGMFN